MITTKPSPEFLKDMVIEAGITSEHISKIDGPQGQKALIQSYALHPDYRECK